jgi:hypothetical protein
MAQIDVSSKKKNVLENFFMSLLNAIRVSTHATISYEPEILAKIQIG